MQSSSAVAVRVGAFAVIAVLLLLFLSVSVTKVKFTKSDYQLVASFRQATGLEPGSKVTLRGVPVGLVSSLEWQPTELRVRTILDINREIKIPENAFATVKSASILGGTIVNIDFDDEAALADQRYLAQGANIAVRDSKTIDDAIEQLAALGEDGSKLFKTMDEGSKEVVGKLNTMLDENRDNIKTTTASFAEAGPKLNSLAGRLDELSAKVQAGEGTVGKLFQSDELYNKIDSIASDVKEVSSQVKSGEGTLGKLIYEDKIATEAESTFRKLGEASDNINSILGENRESIRKFAQSLGDLGPKIQNTVDNFEEISRKINTGDGTLGKLVNDGELFDEAKKAFSQVAESFEGSEEQGVVRSFFGLIFGALV